MIRFFRSSQIIVIIVILLTGILTWLHVFVESETVVSDEYGAFMFLALSGWLSNVPVLYTWFALILFLCTAVLLVVVNTRLQIVDKTLYLPALCYVLLIGGIPEIHLFNPALIAAILLIVGFTILVDSFKSEHLSYSFFTASVFIATATFFYQYMHVYILVVWTVIALWRIGYWREWVFSILGFAFPFFLAFSWFFLVDDDYTRMGEFFNEMFLIKSGTPTLSISFIAFFVLCTAAAIICLSYVLQLLRSKKVIYRTMYYVLILIIVATVGMVIIVPGTFLTAWYLLAFPLSYIMANYLANVRSKRWGTVVLSVLFAGVVAAHAIYLK